MCVMALIRAEPFSSESHREDAAKENEESSLRLCGLSPELISLVSLWGFIHPELRFHGGFTVLFPSISWRLIKHPEFLS